MPKILLYPHDVPIPKGADIALFRSKKDGLRYYKKWNDSIVKLQHAEGDLYYIREEKVSGIINYTGELFDYFQTDDGLAITFYPAIPNQAIAVAGLGGSGARGAQGSQGAQGSSANDAWLLDGNTLTAERYIGTDSAHDFPIRTNNIERARFTQTNRLRLVDGFIIEGPTADKVKITFDNTTPSLDLFVDTGGGVIDDDFMGAGFNIKSSTYAGTRVNMGITSEASLGAAVPSVGFRATELRIRSYGLVGYASDAAAGVGGLTTGDLWYTAGHATLPNGVLMRKA